MSRRDGIQLAIGKPMGRRGSLWDIWFGARDIYVGANHVFGQWKSTIHYESASHTARVRYTGCTTEFARKTGRSLARNERADHEWPGMELRPGSDYFLELRLRIPESELRPLGTGDLRPLNRGEMLSVHWVPAPQPGWAAEVSIISAPPMLSGPRPTREDGAPDLVVHSRQLANGRNVWIVLHEIPVPSRESYAIIKQGVAVRLSRAQRKAALSKTARLVLSIDCGDGTSALAEFAGDSLQGILAGPER